MTLQMGAVQRAEALPARQPASLPPLIAAARGFRDWIDSGENRAPMRAAMIRFWRQRGLLRLPVPLTGAAALGAEQSWDREEWLPALSAGDRARSRRWPRSSHHDGARLVHGAWRYRRPAQGFA